MICPIRLPQESDLTFLYGRKNPPIRYKKKSTSFHKEIDRNLNLNYTMKNTVQR